MNPLVSLIVPCRNEERYIARCIESVLNSAYPKDRLEVLVCDGLSEDRTPEIVRSYATQSVRLIKNPQQTTPFALNAGIREAKGEIIIILGAHAEIDPAFIRQSVETFALDPDIGCSGGLLETISEDNKSNAIALAMSSPFGVGNAHFRTGQKEGFVDTVAFGAYKREVFEKAGLFDESLTRNQDDEFNFRLLKSGYKIYLNPAIRAKYYSRSSFGKLFRQYFQYGYWKVYVNRKHKTITTLRQLVPAAFVLFVFTAILFSFLLPESRSFSLAIFAFYLFAAVWFAKKLSTWKEIPAVILSFLILHISYGTGYLLGILNFILLNKKPSKASEKLSR